MKTGDASFSRDGVVALMAVHLAGFMGLQASSFLFNQGMLYHHLMIFFSMIEYPGYLMLDLLSRGGILIGWKEGSLSFPALFAMNALLYGGAGFLLGSIADGVREMDLRRRFERISPEFHPTLSQGECFSSGPVESKPVFQR